MVQAKFIGRIIHQLHQPAGLVDNNGAVAPGKYGSKKTGDLNILFHCIAVRNGYGIR